MKRLIGFIVLAGALVFMAISCYKEDIENLQKQIDNLKSEEIATIETQISSINTSVTELKSVDNTLKEYITALQSDSKKYAQQIADLAAMDKTLETKITDLQKYVDSEIKDTKDWTSTTFATLDQMDSVATVVAKVVVAVKQVSADLDSVKKEVTRGYAKAIEAATTKLETSMKKWVNEQLADYYTIAKLDAVLDSLGKNQSKIDSSMIEKIQEQQIALDTAKRRITAAYKEAIKIAIDSLQGKFDVQLATEIATAKNALQAQIDTINSEITNIKNRLSTAEASIDDLINQIQSVVVIPQYDDGSVDYQKDTYDTISFEIMPASAVQALATAWNSATDENRAMMVSFKIQEVLTKTDAPTADIDTVFISDGEFKVRVEFNNLPENSMVSLHIVNGRTDVSSSYFGIHIVSGGEGSCLAAGTLITMADGSLKRVEEIVEGDIVRTFDHEAGKLSSARICLAQQEAGKAFPVTLNFFSGNNITITGSQGMLEKSTRKYVLVHQGNVGQYVGKSFYNAQTGVWDELVGYQVGNEAVERYAIYSAYHLNFIAENMLVVEDDVNFILNIYELDESLKADANQLASDIAKYGLFDVSAKYPDYAQFHHLMEELGSRYFYVLLGKGLVPANYLENVKAYWESKN